MGTIVHNSFPKAWILPDFGGVGCTTARLSTTDILGHRIGGRSDAITASTSVQRVGRLGLLRIV
jgi:hypothetical protein